MKLTIERAKLLKTLSHVQSVVEKRHTIPILANVLIRAEEGRLSLNATDMEIDIVESVEAAIERSGTTTAPAHTLHDIIKKLPDGAQVEIEHIASDDRLQIRSGKSRFNLACLPVAEFPVLSAGELPHKFFIPAADLRKLIDRTRFAICNEETRYYLNGIYFHVQDGAQNLRGVATDGHRLAKAEVPLPEGASSIPGVIFPKKAVGELRKLVDETGQDIEVNLSDAKIRFMFDDTVFTSKLIDGSFPEYERVIPKGNDKILEIKRKSLMEATDRVSTVSNDKTKSVKLLITHQSVTVSSTSPDNDSASEETDGQYVGLELEIGFNSRYLLDILQEVEGETVTLAMNDPGGPTIIQDPSDTAAIYVLMPMRV